MAKLVTVKAKRGKIGLVLLVDPSITLNEFKKLISRALSETNVLSNQDEDADIDIPVPEFETSEITAKIAKNESSEEVDFEQLKLALPQDKTNFDAGWNELQNYAQKLSALDVHNGTTFAFALNDEGFEVEIPKDTEAE